MISTQLQSATVWANIWVGLPLKHWLAKIWWRYLPGATAELPWPSGPVEVGPDHRHWNEVVSGEPRQTINSSDPNDHYRPWLEKHVGRQGWDWDWQWTGVAYCPGRYGARVTHDTVLIKVRRCHKEKLAEFVLYNGR